jgi:hypothetical protein
MAEGDIVDVLETESELLLATRCQAASHLTARSARPRIRNELLKSASFSCGGQRAQLHCMSYSIMLSSVLPLILI